MEIQKEMLNSTLRKMGSIFPSGGYIVRKEDVVFHPTSLWDKAEFAKLDVRKMTIEPNSGFSTSRGGNPFKPLSFSFDCEWLGPEPTEVAEIVNFLLPFSASYKQVPHFLADKFFHPALWCSRMLSSFLSGYDPKVSWHTGVYVLGSMSVFCIPYFEGPPRYICSRYEWQQYYLRF